MVGGVDDVNARSRASATKKYQKQHKMRILNYLVLCKSVVNYKLV